MKSATRPDPLTPAERSRQMALVRGRDTRPELQVRSALHLRGLRFRLHARELPGRPDLVLRRHRAVILVHGCFWHDHGCNLSVRPRTRPDFWDEKFRRNRERDERNVRALVTAGWRVVVVWECALRGRGPFVLNAVMDTVEQWVREGDDGIREFDRHDP